MKKTSYKHLSFEKMFEKFIRDSRSGRRLQPNGKRISKGTYTNYGYTLSLIKQFCATRDLELQIKTGIRLKPKEKIKEVKYWKKIYYDFTDFLYKEKSHFDNYVGHTMKNIRAFFNYLDKEHCLDISHIRNLWYVQKEEIPILTLSPEELNFLISDIEFDKSLGRRLKETKDLFVFGCTVALRFSDLISLRRSKLRFSGNNCYLVVRSLKTGCDTMIKLPDYAIEIIDRCSRGRKLLPFFNKSGLNIYINKLLRLANFTQPFYKTRTVRGKIHNFKKDTCFCDLATTHTMRRTAITTMLSLGMPESMVRKISGHAPGSKEFYRYVSWSQAFGDCESEKVFEKLLRRQFVASNRLLLNL